MKSYISSDLKRLNRQNVYHLLFEKRQISKSEISRITGISPPTVIKIINYFTEKGLINEIGEGTSALGRKPQMLELNQNRFFSIGVIHEGDFLKAGVVNLHGEIKAIRKIKVRESFFALINNTLPVIIENLMADLAINIKDILGIGIGIPGVYDVKNKTILSAPLIGISEPVDISLLIDNLKSKFDMPIIVENDLNMEVIGEFENLNLGEKDDLVYLSLGTGFGAGVILNGQLRRGHNYMCGEIGYMAFIDDYVANVQNAGWLESKINLNVLQQKFNFTDNTQLDSNLIDHIVEYVSIPIALCINNIMTCLDCANISIGGIVFDILDEKLYETIKHKINDLCVTKINLYKQVCVDPGIIGASSIVSDLSLRKLWVE
jgi:predicted NBD/HSP70 family sugar kinase